MFKMKVNGSFICRQRNGGENDEDYCRSLKIGMFRDIPILYVLTAFIYDFRTNRN
jgi:hypothetical protein